MRNTLPDFPGVDVVAWSWNGDQLIRVEYIGTEADILAAGITTTEVLSKRPPRGPRGRRLDCDGDKIHLTRWNLVQDGIVVQRFKVIFKKKSVADAMKLPGFAAAWRRYQEQERVSEDESHERQHPRCKTALDNAVNLETRVELPEQIDATMQCVRSLVKIAVENIGRIACVNEAAQQRVDSTVDLLEQQLGRVTAASLPLSRTSQRGMPLLRLVVDNTKH